MLLTSPLLVLAASAVPLGLPMFALLWLVSVSKFAWLHRASNWTRWVAIPGALGFLLAIVTMIDRLSVDLDLETAQEPSAFVSISLGIAVGCYLTLCLALERALREAEPR